MATKTLLFTFLLLAIATSCSKNIDYSQEHINQTSGRYLFSPDEVVDVYYDSNKLYLKWRGAEKLEPVVLDEHTFFVADMYKKLRFVQQPETKKYYLSIIPEDENAPLTYDYLKVSDSFKTPSMYLQSKNYSKALEGFLEIKKQDSTSIFIEEGEINELGYEKLRKKEFQDAIEVFKINVALYPDSDNVYDSLADAYLRHGDSLQAFNNYTKALELNTGNKRAKKFIETYKKN
ncbi:tetratricopeptide repeat protein [Formosa maritima]|uniref:Tetratricopeptide repeat protein n=1 Tax=Formosa maritima TaxID=2592046 RepID=A0A5D0GCE0_9FLAO|nr:tetratricopeptide repeat protein [Formosa maritima]TYA56683.1 tetratricopeptide repeat protein [Formosa maritima]